MHRNLKCSNILPTKLWRAKICGFFFVTDFEPVPADRPGYHPVDYTPMVGTVGWMAPEMLKGVPYSQSVDIFSFGCVLWEVFTRHKNPLPRIAHPEHDKGIEMTAFNEESARRVLPSDIPDRIWTLMCDCLKYDPSERPTFAQLQPRLKEIRMEVKSHSLRER